MEVELLVRRRTGCPRPADGPVAFLPLTTVGGVVSHIRWVEPSSVEYTFQDSPVFGPWTDDSPDQELIDGAPTLLAEVLHD